MDLIQTYIIDPIVHREGYNVVNTVVFAIVALIMVYLIERLYKRENIPFMDKDMIISAIPFAIYGGLKRAIVDAVDAGKLSDGIYRYYEYNFWNVTPGIYFQIGLMFAFLYYLEHRFNLKGLTFIVGLALAFLHLMFAFPAVERLEPIIPVMLLSLIPAIWLGKDWLEMLAYFAQALDGASTFIAIEFYGYGEKHVLANLIGGGLGYFFFYLIKIGLVYVITHHLNLKEREKEMVLGFAIILGLAIGTRNLMRLLMGV